MNWLPIPEDRVSSGFVEIGEYLGDEYQFETDANFKMAPDRSIWAKICDSPEELPLNPETKAWNILREADEAVNIVETAKERAANGSLPPPSDIGDYMMWIVDEIEIQEHQLSLHPEETDRESYIRVLRGILRELGSLGFYAHRPPWMKK